MIDPKLALRAAALLATAAAELFEDEHLAMVTAPGADFAAHAERLLSLGTDVAVLGQALHVIVRRTAPEGGA